MFILNQAAPWNPRITRIAYKLLNLLEFQSIDDDNGTQRLIKLCFDTLIHIHDTATSSAPDSSQFIEHVILLMRICSNIVALHYTHGDYIIHNWFQFQNRSISSFFNHFIELLTANGFSVNEIYWFIGNLLKCATNESTIKYLECDHFFAKLNTNHLS